MTHLLPEPRPDETLHSIVARYLDLFPERAAPAILDDLLGGRGRALAVDLPQGLSRFLSRAGIGMNIAANDLVSRHTLLPLLRPFVDGDTLARALEDMLESGHPHMALGLAPSGPLVNRYLKLCPSCVSEDCAAIGVPTWKRIHQLSFVHFCPLHGRALRETKCIASSFGVAFRAARTAVMQPATAWRATDRALLLGLARTAQEILLHPALSVMELPRLYREQLSRARFVRTDGRMRHADLMSALLSTWTASALQRLGVTLGDARDNWVRRICSPRSGHQPPVRHLLMWHALGIGVSGKTGQMRISSEPTARRRGVTTAPTRADRWNRLDRLLERKVRRAAVGAARAGRRASKHFLAIASGKASLIYTRSVNLPRTNQAVEELAQDAAKHARIRVRASRKRLQRGGLPVQRWRVMLGAGLGAEMRKNPEVRSELHGTMVAACRNPACRRRRRR